MQGRPLKMPRVPRKRAPVQMDRRMRGLLSRENWLIRVIKVSVFAACVITASWGPPGTTRMV